jgi:hypothetical protein
MNVCKLLHGNASVNIPSFLSSPLLPRSSCSVAATVDAAADLDALLEELAGPGGAGAEPRAPPPEPRRVGGPLRLRPGSDILHLRILVDHSCVEVFTGTGEVLSTRIYRGAPPEGSEAAGVDLVAFGGAAAVRRMEAWELGSAWNVAETATAEGEREAASVAATVDLAEAVADMAGADVVGSLPTVVLDTTRAPDPCDFDLGPTAAERADALLFDDIIHFGTGPEAVGAHA